MLLYISFSRWANVARTIINRTLSSPRSQDRARRTCRPSASLRATPGASDLKSVPYVGRSRARTHLLLFASSELYESDTFQWRTLDVRRA